MRIKHENIRASISIVITVYNIRYELLSKCVNNVLRQTYDNYEIIIIDDGSNEEYANIVDEICRYNGRIKVLHTKNNGSSAARNIGTKLATGEYITYVDGDDIVETSMLEQASYVARETNADFIIGYSTTVKQDLGKSWGHREYDVLSNDEIELLRGHILDMNNKRFKKSKNTLITPGPIARFLKTSIAKNIIFDETIVLGEDTLWNEHVIDNADSIAVANKCWYYYYNNPQSKTHKFDSDGMIRRGECLARINDIVIKNHPELVYHFDNKVCMFFCMETTRYLLHEKNMMSYIEKRNYIKKQLIQYPYNRLLTCKIKPTRFGLRELIIRMNLFLEVRTLKKWILKR